MKKEAKLSRIGIRLTDREREVIEAEAEKTGKPVSQILRQIIEDWHRNQKRRKAA